jgi:glycosyltransferase involved in cell wall biosynthesis
VNAALAEGRGRSPIERVVIINDDCVESGGAAAIALLSADLLSRRGIPVTFLSGGPGPQPILSERGVKLVCLGGQHLWNGQRHSAAAKGLFDSRTAAALSAWLEANDTAGTCYHLHNWHKYLSPSIFRPLRQVQERLSLTTHDYFLACPNGGFFQYPRERPCDLRPGTIGCILTNCDRRKYAHKLWRVARHKIREAIIDFKRSPARVIAVHEGMIPFLTRGGIPNTAITVLRNPVTPWRTTRVQAERNRDVMFVGRIEEDKGIGLLAAAAREAHVSLRVIGAGPLADDLQERYPEVSFLGWRRREEIAQLIGSARMLILPSRWHETFGLVALEALMSGVPVIMSKFALLSEDLVASGFGLACDPHDIRSLVHTIQELVDDDDRVRQLSVRAFVGARSLAPTPEQWCDELIAHYETLLEASATGYQPDRSAPAWS